MSQGGVQENLKGPRVLNPDQSSGPNQISPEVTAEDLALFQRVIAEEMTPAQQARITHPPESYPQQRVVLAAHWHPEFVPLPLVRQRLDALYPNRELEFVVPTQHNQILSYDGAYSGIELDAYADAFNQKVQLLLHFRNEALARAGALRAMADYTFKYRSSQLFDFIDTIVAPLEPRIGRAVKETGADEGLVAFVRTEVAKVKRMLEDRGARVPAAAIKNKLLRDFFDGLRPLFGHALINRCQAYLAAVKKEVKAEFPLQYFYRVPEVIEEARGLGAGIVVPHPEQFWPILLADYDVDGVEVWNPQSRKYTDFLISVIAAKNQRAGSGRRLLVFMGDDTHLSEKLKEREERDPAKAAREIGLQPVWEDLAIKKMLVLAKMDIGDVLEEYRGRLA